MRIFLLFAMTSFIMAGCKDTPPEGDSGSGKEPPSEKTYIPISLTDGAIGSYSESDGELTLNASTANSIYGVCLPNEVTGHFMAQATANNTDGFGIAIVREFNGKPDYSNFTSVSICTESGVPVARVIDRQSGVDNVLDNTGVILAKDKDFRYSARLDEDYFSLPYDSFNGKVRILRNDISGFYHFYVGVTKLVDGRNHENWLELAQSKDNSISGRKLYVCPIVRTTANNTSEVVFSDIVIETFSPEDISDAATGFAVKERPYTWAGFPGEATVVTFDPRHCPAAAGDRKFVFWSEANYVPAWHMSNELLFCYEFAETWSGLNPGCYEPMSDRLLAYTDVEIVEDNNVRKTIKYHYALVNPDYKAPYPGGVFPEVDEYYTFYPDGVGVRRIEYTQKAAGEGYYRSHELSEPMVISGSSSIPAAHFKYPAFVISNLAEERYELYPDKSKFNEIMQNSKSWNEQIYSARLVDAPDPFCVFSYTDSRPEVSPLPIEPELTWHDTGFQMSHWPVDKQKYLLARSGDYDKSMATWGSQVSHSSLVGIEAMEGTDWADNYQTRPNGDKYRVYLMLFGISEPDAAEEIKAASRAWLYQGGVSDLSGLTYDPSVTGYSKREIVLAKDGAGPSKLKFTPNGVIKNPVFRIDNWNNSAQVSVTIDGNQLAAGDDFIADMSDGSLIIWLHREGDQPYTITIE